MTQEASAAAIEAALHARVDAPSPRASGVRADIHFEVGDRAWTVRFADGRASLREGLVFRPAARIRADAETMLAVIEGRMAGVDAFLREKLTFRGNIGLALELDDLLHPPVRHPRAPRVHRVVVDGLRTFVLEAGPPDGRPVVLVHGLGATSASFLPTVWDLSRDHRVLALDLPGFGETDKPLRPLRPAFFARHIVAMLDAMGIERAHVVGNSLGGRVAIEVALRAPERVDRIALLAPSMAWRRFRFAAAVVRLLRHEIAFMPLPVLRWVVVRTLRSMFAVPDRLSTAAANAAADEFLRVFSTGRGRVAFFNAAREIYLEEPHGKRGFWDRLPSLSRPALFVFGDHDWLVPSRFARVVTKTIPTARCEILAGCGHVPQFEMPEHTHRLVRSFFDAP